MRRQLANDVGDDCARQRIENLGIAEEARHIDQQILGQQITFGGILAKEIEIEVQVATPDREQGHTSFDTALECPRLILPEIMCGLVLQQVDDLGKACRLRITGAVIGVLEPAGDLNSKLR